MALDVSNALLTLRHELKQAANATTRENQELATMVGNIHQKCLELATMAGNLLEFSYFLLQISNAAWAPQTAC